MKLVMIWLQIAILCAALAIAVPAKGADPAPYTATYAVSYRGLNAGLLHFELREVEPGLFIYATRPEPSLLARVLVGSDALERSTLRIDASGVRPLFWQVEDGKSGNRNDGELVFDWDTGWVRGMIKGQPVALPTVPGLQDRLSFQIAIMTALLRGIEPDSIPMISEDTIKVYSYTQVGRERIKTRAGEFATVLYESTRPGSKRLSRIWHAPILGYIAVRAEQVRKGRVETVMELVAVAREQP